VDAETPLPRRRALDERLGSGRLAVRELRRRRGVLSGGPRRVGGTDTCPGTPRDPTTLHSGSTLSRYDDYVFTPAALSAACKTAVTGPTRGADVVDSFVVPAGKTLSLAIKGTVGINGKPVDTWVGFLSPVCGTAAESAAACVSAGAAPSWTNTSAAPQTIHLFPDRQSPSPAQADFQVTPTLD
jgi:hypothetical protein